MADRHIRIQVWEVLKLQGDKKYAEALTRATDLALANPGYAPALNLAGRLHVNASIAAWKERAPGNDEAAFALVTSHRRAAVDALSAAARIAPNCVQTAVLCAEALACSQRYADALRELSRVFSMPETKHDDPAVHHAVYDFIDIGSSTAKKRKSDALHKAGVLRQKLTATINNQIVPREAVKLLGGDTAVDQVRERAELLCDEFDESERECRRALRIEEPTDPNIDDIPPAVSVPGADYDARVSSVKKQPLVFLKHIVVAAALYWCSIKSTPHHERIISVKVKTLQEHYNRIDKSAAKTISDALRFLKTQSSWSFLICPNSRCDGKKFVDTKSLWEHMRSKHRDELWEKLLSVLGPDLNENASEDDHSLDGITLCQDSDKHDIFQLPRVQDMFESLLLSPSMGIQAEPLAEMRQRKCREGSEILEDIKEKLEMLPEDTLSTEFEEFCFGIQNLWLKFLKISLLDYREAILPLARSFQWTEIKQWIACNVNDPYRSIGDANIDAVFGKVPAAPVHQSGDDLQPEKLKPSCADETVKADEKCEESEVRVVDSNSGTMLDQSSSDPPTDVDESVMNIAEKIAEVELDKKGTSGQSVKEIASTSSYQQSLNVFNKNNADKDLSILSLIIRSLCNLRCFRDKLLTDPLVWIPSVDNPCIAQKLYEIFSSWEKNDHHLTDVVLTYMKTLLCRIVNCTIFFEKLQAGTNFASEIVATIFIGLHMSETCSSCSLYKVTKDVVNPITCGDCICPTHNLFGIKFNVQMSCQCGMSSGEYLYTTLFHKLDAGSPETTKIKSFADLPVLLDEQFYEEQLRGLWNSAE